jgi:hypothetical protein
MASPNEVAEEEVELLDIKLMSTDVDDDLLHAYAKKIVSNVISKKLSGDVTESNRLYGQAAKEIKELLDANQQPTWHVIIGRNFGSQVIHQVGSFIFMSHAATQTSVLMWKAG